MAKGIRIFQFRLNPDVQVEEFERFVTEELTKVPLPSGVRMQFMKCDRDSKDWTLLERMPINSSTKA